MNREIKYRAYHKTPKIVVDVLLIDWLNELVDLEGGLIEQEFEDVVLLQYTGLKDKNGVEIYEGDILMAGDAYLGVIEYHSTRAQFIGRNIGKSFPEDEYDTLYTKNGRFNSAEVIGNIYENPEILEGKAE